MKVVVFDNLFELDYKYSMNDTFYPWIMSMIELVAMRSNDRPNLLSGGGILL